MTYLYDIDDKLHIITPRTDDRGSCEENSGCPRYGNDMTNYIVITEVYLFDKVPKYYINYFDTFGFIVDNLMVTYYPIEHKRDPNTDDKVQLPWQLTRTRSKNIRGWVSENIGMNK